MSNLLSVFLRVLLEGWNNLSASGQKGLQEGINSDISNYSRFMKSKTRMFFFYPKNYFFFLYYSVGKLTSLLLLPRNGNSCDRVSVKIHFPLAPTSTGTAVELHRSLLLAAVSPNSSSQLAVFSMFSYRELSLTPTPIGKDEASSSSLNFFASGF